MDTIKYNDEFENRNKVCGAFASALLTRVAMGFSPTLYASKNRTFIFVEFTIIFLIVCIYSENEQKITDNKKFMAY